MELEKKKQYLILAILPFFMLIYSLFLEPVNNIFPNLMKIFIANDFLLTDYFVVAGKQATIVNASIIALLNLYLVYKLDMKINGVVIAGIYIMFGFSFMGKNLLNILPFYLGGFLHSYYFKKPFKSVVIVTMFSCALAPFTTAIVRFFDFNLFGFLVSILFGAFLAFIMPAIASHVLQFHKGYNLYNTGLANGLVGIIFYSILRSAGIETRIKTKTLETMDYKIVILLILVFIFYIIYGYIKNGYSFNGFKSLLSHSGRLVSDFTATEGFNIVLINMGILGLVSLIIIFLFFPIINGPIITGIISILAFSGFGKHIKNIIPVMLGVVLAHYTFGEKMYVTSYAITVFLSTTLAPIGGKFGFLAGAISGFLTYCLVTNIGPTHGGLNLYNTGLSAGIIACVFVPLLELIEKEEK